ncbi:conserved hypothetical protein [Frankia sp. Hr75.2]|nr:conserved hypothetical protein [Frankia sp. Hr75.2]
MVQFAMLLLPVPLGVYISGRRTAYLITAIVFAITLVIQTIVVAADTPDDINPLYWLLNIASLAVGLGLTAAGRALGRRRRTRRAAG